MKDIVEWHARACPNPTQETFEVQLGCHFEEIAEMVNTLCFVVNDQAVKAAGTALELMLESAAKNLKEGKVHVTVDSRIKFCDSLADQIVTLVGVAYRAGIDLPKAVDIVNKSNWSKFDDRGKPLFNQFGKIRKGPNYTPPDLTECI